MKIETILEQLNRIFLDSAPIIYYVESNTIIFGEFTFENQTNA